MHRNKKLSLFEARSCVDELGHPSKLPYDWKPTLVMQGPPGRGLRHTSPSCQKP
jgi:hypothetical protein